MRKARKIDNLESLQKEFVCKIIDAKQPILIFSRSLDKDGLQNLITGEVKCDKIEWFDCKQVVDFSDLLFVLQKENAVIVLEDFDVILSSVEKKEHIEVLFSKIAKNESFETQNNKGGIAFSFKKNSKSVVFLSRKDTKTPLFSQKEAKDNSETIYNQFVCSRTIIPLTKEIVKETLIENSKQTIKKREQSDNIGNKEGQMFGKEKNKEYGQDLNINKFPHLFVLGCLMDKQISAEKALEIPLKVCKVTDKWSVDELSDITIDRMKKIFEDNHLHRFNNEMSEVFVLAVKRIKEQYDKDASKIWKGEPTSAEIVYKFLEFKGAGIKIATMAANILQRDFKVKFSDLSAIDASPDIQVRRMLYRLGFTEDESNANMAVYMSKAINPEFPGLIDYPCWLWGRDYCHPQSPECNKCPVAAVCISSLEKYANGKIE